MWEFASERLRLFFQLLFTARRESQNMTPKTTQPAPRAAEGQPFFAFDVDGRGWDEAPWDPKTAVNRGDGAK